MVTLRQAMDRLFEGSFVNLPQAAEESAFLPAVDIVETEDKVGIKASIPGVKPEDIDINITADGVTIKGERKSETEVNEENYVRRECRYGSFTRTIALPPGLKIDKAEATVDNGMLTLEIPKAEEVKPRSVKVKAKAEPKKLEAKEAGASKN
jgi:HSP20 family protein